MITTILLLRLAQIGLILSSIYYHSLNMFLLSFLFHFEAVAMVTESKLKKLYKILELKD